MQKVCPKCNNEMVKAKAIYGVVKRFLALRLPFRHLDITQSSELMPFVCANCGYAEWYVENPEFFKS